MDKREEASKIVNAHLAGSAGYAFVTSPIPGTTLGVVAIETKMVYEVAKVYGYNLSPAETTGLVASLTGVGAAVRMTLSQVLTFVPGAGYVAKAAIAGGSSYLLGQAAIDYFENKHEEDTRFA